jgi:hypothetical protein
VKIETAAVWEQEEEKEEKTLLHLGVVERRQRCSFLAALACHASSGVTCFARAYVGGFVLRVFTFPFRREARMLSGC